MKQQVQHILEHVAGVPVTVSVPENPLHGDYATNIALQNSNPRKFAEELKNKIVEYQKVSGAGIIERVEVAGPGFLNLFLSEASISTQIQEVLKKKEAYGRRPKLQKNEGRESKLSGVDSQKKGQKGVKNTGVHAGDFGDTKTGKKQQKDSRKNADHENLERQNKESGIGASPDLISAERIIVEFADPNPFKEIHIGHVRNIALGESFCRLLETSGHTVHRANYEGDVGMHVAKAIYALQKGESYDRAYAVGAKAFEASQSAKNEIATLNKQIYAQDPFIGEVYTKGRQWSLDRFETVYRRLGTHFDRYYFESEVAPLGMKLVLDHPEVFEQSEGAWVFRGSHTRVFVTSEGYATYEAKDLALAPLKYTEWPYDLSIIMTGNEQTDYFKVMLEALARIHPDLAAKTRHIPFGMVNLKSGKMSSRTGDVITADWLIEEAKKKISIILSSNRTNYSKEQKEDITEKAAVAAVKYSMLRVTASSDIAFDIEASVSFDGDSGPYLQYTYARANSVLRKAGTFDRIPLEGLNTEERALARAIMQFPDVVGDAADTLAPNTICTYLFRLAQQFNLFYTKHPIVGNATRLQLTEATAQVLTNGLYLLGIEPLEQM